MPKPEVIINGLTNALQENPSVTAFALVGSQVRKGVYSATAHSDLEAYIISQDGAVEDVEQGLPGLVSGFGNVLFSFKHQIGFVAVYDDLLRVELPVIKQSDISSTFKRPKAQVVEVLFDRTDGQLEQVLSQRPETLDYPELFSDKMTNFWYWQITGVQYFKKGEIYNSRAVLNIHASALIKLFELLNDPNTLLLETNKRVEEFLNEKQLEQLRLVAPDYDPNEINHALRNIMDIFPKVAKEIKEKYGYSYDESIEEQVKPKLLDLLNA